MFFLKVYRLSSYILVVFVFRLLSHVQLFTSLWPAAHQPPLSFTVSKNLLRFMFIESVMLSYHLIPCCPLLLLSSIFPRIRVFSNQLALHSRWPKHWSFSNSISPSYNIQGWFPLGFTDFLSLQSKGLPRVFFSNTIWKYQFFGAEPSLWSNSHIHTQLLEKP